MVRTISTTNWRRLWIGYNSKKLIRIVFKNSNRAYHVLLTMIIIASSSKTIRSPNSWLNTRSYVLKHWRLNPHVKKTFMICTTSGSRSRLTKQQSQKKRRNVLSIDICLYSPTTLCNYAFSTGQAFLPFWNIRVIARIIGARAVRQRESSEEELSAILGFFGHLIRLF